MLRGWAPRVAAAALVWLGLAGRSSATCTDAVTNGSFESGITGWTHTVVSGSGTAHGSGAGDAQCGSDVGRLYKTAGGEADHAIWQDVSIPGTAIYATLTFRWTIGGDYCNYNDFRMQIRNASGAVLATPVALDCCPSSTCSCGVFQSWTTVTWDMTSYIGTTVRLWFEQVTYFGSLSCAEARVDCVALSWCNVPPSGTSTRSRTATRSGTRTATPTATVTATRTNSGSATVSGTPTATETCGVLIVSCTATATGTTSETATRSASRTVTETTNGTETHTGTPSATDLPSDTPSETGTPSPSRTGSTTPTGSASDTASATGTATAAASATATGSASDTASATGTATAAASATATASASDTVSATGTATAAASATATASETTTNTETSSRTATSTHTSADSHTPTATGSAQATGTATGSLTVTITATAAAPPSASATATETTAAQPVVSATATIAPRRGPPAVFPNPVPPGGTVRFGGLPPGARVHVYDLRGEAVRTPPVEADAAGIARWAPSSSHAGGLYFYVARSGAAVVSEGFVVLLH